MRIKIYRKIEGCIKAVIIKREGERWFAIVQADQEQQPLPETGEAVGLDVGLTSFVVDSVGNEIENPRCAEQSEDKLVGLQRKLARAVKGSKNYGVIKGKIAKLHKRINCQRDDFLHKLSRMYVNNFDIVCVEDLDVKGLREKGHNTGMHRSIHDASWSKFIFMLSYKAQSAGRKLIKIDPRNTTQRCSACASIVKKDLSVRVHECPYCGFSCDRDYNASRNILLAGMEQPVAPIESKPLHHISVMPGFGDEVGSRALQDAVVHLFQFRLINFFPFAENNLNARVNRCLVTVFRAYDVRGVYGTELTEDLARRVGVSFGSFAGGGSVSLGRDTRISGPSLEKAFLEGVLTTGCHVQSYGIIPIAVLSFITRKMGLKAAAYISASHNPPEYNGVRFRTGDGYGLLYQESSIMKFYREGGFLSGIGRAEDRSSGEAIDEYRSYVADKLHLERPLKVVLDMGNGSACTMNSFYENLEMKSSVINGIMDGHFPGRGPAPNEESLQPACQEVQRCQADFGVGFDPDADRGIIIDDLGRVLPPEKVAIIIARRRYKRGDLVISGFDCSMMLERELQKDGIRILREKVGDVFVANRVKNENAVLGVERSGHFFLPEFQYSDDPFAMSLAIAEIISKGEKLSTLADEIPDYPYKQISIRLNEDPAGVMLRLKDALAGMQPNTLDGLKITTDSYSVLIRPSNTEPILRLYIETAAGDMKELVEHYEKIIHKAMKA